MTARALFLSAFTSLMLLAPAAMATMSVSYVTGSVSSPDGTAPSNSTNVYYSNVGTGTFTVGTATYYSDANGGACNTAINKHCHTAADALQVNVSTSVSPVAGAQMYVMIQNTAPTSLTQLTGVSFSPSIASGYVASATYTISIPYTSICAAWATAVPTSNIDGNCHYTAANDNTNKTITIYVIADTDNSHAYNTGDDILTISLTLVSTPVAYAVNNTVGMYDFTAYPGDSKVYIRSTALEQVPFPAGFDGVGAIYQRFFLGTTDFASLGPSASETNFKDLQYNSDGTLQNTAITGLNNGTRYYFRSVAIDAAGNEAALTANVAGNDSLVDIQDKQSTIPDRVLGLLENTTNCFIATAAFGSPMAAQVQILRDFRDRFLLKTKWGTKFVLWYYDHAPVWADRIRTHDNARFVVRLFLYPVIWFSALAMKIGAYNASLAFSTLLLLPLLLLTWFKTSRKMKKERA